MDPGTGAGCEGGILESYLLLTLHPKHQESPQSLALESLCL